MLVDPSASRTPVLHGAQGEAALLTLTGALQLLQIPRPPPKLQELSIPLSKRPGPCPMQGVMPPGSFIWGGVSAVEPLRAAGQINHCLGTCVCTGCRAADCLSSFHNMSTISLK